MINTCIYQSYTTPLTSVSISLWTQAPFLPPQINAAQAKYSDFVGGFDYEVQVKSFQTEGM